MPRTRRLSIVVAVVALAVAGASWRGVFSGGAQAAASGGTLNVASVVDIPSLDPHAVTFAWSRVNWPLMFDALTNYTAKGGLNAQPGIAVRWTSSPNLKTWTFFLRNGVKFSNGKPVNAAAVVANIKRALDPKTGFFLRSNFSTVTSTVAVNPSTVRITLSEPSVSLPEKLTTIQIIDTSPDALANVKSAPIGTGPFVVQDFVPADHVTYAPNPNYWGKKPSLAGIKIVKAQDPSSAITSLDNNDLQALGNVGLDNIQAITKGGNASVIIAKSTTGAMMFVMDNSSPPFNNVNVRQGLAYATDRKSMLAAALSGVGTVSAKNLPLPGSFLPGSIPNVPFDLKKAGELFAKGGVKKGDTWTFWTVASQPFYSVEAEILQRDLAKLGVTLKIQTADVAQWAARVYPPPKKYPNMISSEWYTGLPAPQNLWLWNPPVCECNWKNQKFVNLLKQADATRDSAKRKALYAQAAKVMQADSPTIIVSITGIPIAVRKNVTGVWLDPIDTPHFESAVMTG